MNMPTTNAEYRMERIKRLLQELKYECIRGMMEGEIDETIQYQFLVPQSKSIPRGAVLCSFVTRPVLNWQAHVNPHDDTPILKVVK